MRLVQYKILTEILDKVVIPDYIYGFEKNKSIPVMAQNHTEKDVVLSLDIKNFFPTIKQYMVKELFLILGEVSAPCGT